MPNILKSRVMALLVNETQNERKRVSCFHYRKKPMIVGIYRHTATEGFQSIFYTASRQPKTPTKRRILYLTLKPRLSNVRIIPKIKSMINGTSISLNYGMTSDRRRGERQTCNKAPRPLGTSRVGAFTMAGQFFLWFLSRSRLY